MSKIGLKQIFRRIGGLELNTLKKTCSPWYE